MFETYWIYTNAGVKVGQFNVCNIGMIIEFMTEQQFIAHKFHEACRYMRIDPRQHSYCIAAE